MDFLVKRGNDAVNVNPPTLNGQFADIHITNRGSDFLWAIFSMFVFTTLAIIFLAYRKPAEDRAFHYITASVTAVASIAYFTMASDLGFTPTTVEYQRGGNVAGTSRQVFYARYVDWFITTPLLLMDLLLTAGVPWPRILWVVIMDWIMIVTGLIGALVPSRYKWGYFTFGCAAMFYIFWTMAGPARKSAKMLGGPVSRCYQSAGVWTLALWTLYPIAWGVADGGNVIAPDSEMVFYGILDVLTKIGFSIILLVQHEKIDPAIMGMKIRSLDAVQHNVGPTSEKKGHFSNNAGDNQVSSGAATGPLGAPHGTNGTNGTNGAHATV